MEDVQILNRFHQNIKWYKIKIWVNFCIIILFSVINNLCEDIEKINNIKTKLEEEITILKTPLSHSNSRLLKLQQLQDDIISIYKYIIEMKGNGEYYASQISLKREYLDSIKDYMLKIINNINSKSKENIAKKWIESHGDAIVKNIQDREIKDVLGVIDNEITLLLYKYECYIKKTDYYNISQHNSSHLNAPNLPTMDLV